MMDDKSYARLNWVIRKCETLELSKWEREFMGGMVIMRDNLGQLMRLSDRQKEILEEIANK